MPLHWFSAKYLTDQTLNSNYMNKEVCLNREGCVSMGRGVSLWGRGVSQWGRGVSQWGRGVSQLEGVCLSGEGCVSVGRGVSQWGRGVSQWGGVCGDIRRNLPVSFSLSLNMGMMRPSCVGPKFMRRFPPQATVVTSSLIISLVFKYPLMSVFLM